MASENKRYKCTILGVSEWMVENFTLVIDYSYFILILDITFYVFLLSIEYLSVMYILYFVNVMKTGAKICKNTYFLFFK